MVERSVKKKVKVPLNFELIVVYIDWSHLLPIPFNIYLTLQA